MPIPIWAAQLLAYIARSVLPAAGKAAAKKAIKKAVVAGGINAALENPVVKKFLGDAAGRVLGKATGAFSDKNVNRTFSGTPEFNSIQLRRWTGLQDLSTLLDRFDDARRKQFFDSAQYLFLQRYVLPKMLGGGVFNSDGTFNPLALIAAINQQIEGRKSVERAFENRDRLPPYPWLPAVRKPAGLPALRPEASPPIVARTLGWGGWNVDDLLDELYDDPMGYWEKQMGPGGTKAIGEDPFAQQNAEMDWRRAQRRKDAEFDWETKKLLDKDKQEWIDRHMADYYAKPKSQWLKEKLFEGAGTLSGIVGEGFNIYNSALANALMQSAASMVTPRQAELYGNPFEGTTAMYAGGRQAFGGIADSVGRNIGEFLRDWSDDIRAEFERQRIMRLQMDNPQTGRVIETIGDARASDTRFRGNWNGRRSK